MSIQIILMRVEELLSQHTPSVTASKDLKHITTTGYNVQIATSSKLVQFACGNVIVASSRQALLVYESFHIPAFYIPLKHVRMDLMKRSFYRTYCPFKGYASHWSLTVGKRIIKNVALTYEKPPAKVSILKDYMTFDWRQPGCWYKEEEALFCDTIKPQWSALSRSVWIKMAL